MPTLRVNEHLETRLASIIPQLTSTPECGLAYLDQASCHTTHGGIRGGHPLYSRYYCLVSYRPCWSVHVWDRWKSEWEEHTYGIMQILRTFCLTGARYLIGVLISFSFTWHKELQTAQASFISHQIRRHLMSCATTRSTSYLFPQPQLLMWCQSVTHTLSRTGRTDSDRDHIVYWQSRVWEISHFYGATSMQKVRGEAQDVNCRPTPELT